MFRFFKDLDLETEMKLKDTPDINKLIEKIEKLEKGHGRKGESGTFIQNYIKV